MLISGVLVLLPTFAFGYKCSKCS